MPILADEGRYLASESTFYRVLREAEQQHHRGRSKAPQHKPSSTHCASGPNQVWCWDITWLPGPVRGLFYYLYLVLDLYSRKIVAWEVGLTATRTMVSSAGDPALAGCDTLVLPTASQQRQWFNVQVPTGLVWQGQSMHC